jgi:Cu(I)/Ag(I) efflux system membrane fusion protein
MMLQLQNKISSNNKVPPMDMKNSAEMKVKEQ